MIRRQRAVVLGWVDGGLRDTFLTYHPGIQGITAP